MQPYTHAYFIYNTQNNFWYNSADPNAHVNVDLIVEHSLMMQQGSQSHIQKFSLATLLPIYIS